VKRGTFYLWVSHWSAKESWDEGTTAAVSQEERDFKSYLSEGSSGIRLDAITFYGVTYQLEKRRGRSLGNYPQPKQSNRGLKRKHPMDYKTILMGRA